MKFKNTFHIVFNDTNILNFEIKTQTGNKECDSHHQTREHMSWDTINTNVATIDQK